MSSSRRPTSSPRKRSCERGLPGSADPAALAYRPGYAAAGGSLRMDEAALTAFDALVDVRGRFADNSLAGPLRRGAETTAGALGEDRRLRGRGVPAHVAAGPDRVLREPGDPLAAPHPADLVLPLRRRPLRHRRRRLPNAGGDLRARDWRDRAK